MTKPTSPAEWGSEQRRLELRIRPGCTAQELADTLERQPHYDRWRLHSARVGEASGEVTLVFVLGAQ